MAQKDILLFGSIWEYKALYVFDQIKQALKDDPDSEFVLRVNCEGGSPEYCMSIINKIQELESEGKIAIVAEGMAHSMALFFLAYVKNAAAIDTCQGVLHRGAYPKYFEEHPDFAGSIQAQSLARTNKNLEKAFRAKVDVAALEALPQFTEKKITLKDIFSMDARHEVLLTAADMKKVGLINNVVKVTPTKSAEITALAAAWDANVEKKIAEFSTFEEFKVAAQAATPTPIAQSQNSDTMTLNELKTKHPELYQQICAEASAAEKERIEAYLAFAEIPEKVKAGIESGKAMSPKQMAEFVKEMASAAKPATPATEGGEGAAAGEGGAEAAALQKIAQASAGTVQTNAQVIKTQAEKEQQTPEQLSLAKTEAALDIALGLKKQPETK